MPRPVGSSNKPKDGPGPAADVKPKATRAPRRVKVTREACDAFVQLIGIPVSVLSSRDALDPTETVALSVALYDAASENAILGNMLMGLAVASGFGELALVSGAIVAKRVVSRQVNERGEVSAQLAGLHMAAGVIIQNVAAKRTSGADRVNRVRENDVSGTGPVDPGSRNNDSDKAGPGELDRVPVSQNGQGDPAGSVE